MTFTTTEHFFLELLRVGLWEREALLSQHNCLDFGKVFKLAEEQAVSGILIQSLEKNLTKLKERPSQELLLQEIGNNLIIQQRNIELDKAVVGLCRLLDTVNSRYIIVKGQTLAALYGDIGYRQSGDIDFYVHPDDWEKTYQLCCDVFHIESVETHSEKHIEWEYQDVMYEMHRMLNDFSSKKHQQYWDEIIMQESWGNPWTVSINGYDVPTLAPTYNAIYVFVHLFFHLISEGVGLRQFIDWGVVLEKGHDDIDRHLLRKHLEGIGLLKAYSGLGTVLIDYLGFSVDSCPLDINEIDHNSARKLMENILQSGNFGHNIRFIQSHGALHGIQQIWRRLGQIIRFGHYAPGESWGMITKTIAWWKKKLLKGVGVVF